MKSKAYNKLLYGKVVKSLEKIAARYEKSSPNLTLVVSMNAKYQTPYISVTNFKTSDVGNVVSNIRDRLDDLGFYCTGINTKFKDAVYLTFDVVEQEVS